MKDFNDFREYMRLHGNDIYSEVLNSTHDIDSDNPLILSHAYTQIAIMKMLEEYHNWLCEE